MMQPITVRDYAVQDRAAAEALYLELNRFEDGISGDRDTHPDAAVACVERAAREVEERGGVLLVAEAGGTVLGLLALGFEEGPPYLRPSRRHFGVVRDLVVQAKFRGHGIGRALLREAEWRTRERGLRTLAISTLATNETAIAAYRAAGFRPGLLEMTKPLDPE